MWTNDSKKWNYRRRGPYREKNCGKMLLNLHKTFHQYCISQPSCVIVREHYSVPVSFQQVRYEHSGRFQKEQPKTAKGCWECRQARRDITGIWRTRVKIWHRAITNSERQRHTFINNLQTRSVLTSLTLACNALFSSVAWSLHVSVKVWVKVQTWWYSKETEAEQTGPADQSRESVFVLFAASCDSVGVSSAVAGAKWRHLCPII